MNIPAVVEEFHSGLEVVHVVFDTGLDVVVFDTGVCITETATTNNQFNKQSINTSKFSVKFRL